MNLIVNINEIELIHILSVNDKSEKLIKHLIDREKVIDFMSRYDDVIDYDMIEAMDSFAQMVIDGEDLLYVTTKSNKELFLEPFNESTFNLIDVSDKKPAIQLIQIYLNDIGALDDTSKYDIDFILDTFYKKKLY